MPDMSSDIRWNDLTASSPDTRALTWTAGTYRMSVDMARQGLTRGGKTKISITFLCKAGPQAGHFYVWDLVYDPDNPRYFLERLHTLGCTPEFLEANPSLAEVCLQIIGLQEYHVTFKDSSFNGRPTTEISYLERA